MVVSDTSIRVSNLGKLYRIGHRQGPYRTLRETITDTLSAPIRFLRAPQSAVGNHQSDTLWALEGACFEIRRGEVVGIIGGNGAGKSTLLKVLSRITEPTVGRAEIDGRVGSLLEVGTGFHQELTGRENIYLNGAILGMKEAEIRRKFDEIVSFAEVDQFIDTPVKHYSSGMYVRLAFAVAAHLEPENLLVDEVLAVGDLQFQKKCLAAIRDSVEGGRTVLLVSHNMAAISQLCSRTLWLERGHVRSFGSTHETIEAYLRSSDASDGNAEAIFAEDRTRSAQVRRVRLLNQSNVCTRTFHCDEPIVIEVELQVNRSVLGLYGYLDILRSDGTVLLMSDSQDIIPNPLDLLLAGTHIVRVIVPPRILGHGEYKVYLCLGAGPAGAQVDTPGTGIVAGFSVDDLSTSRGNKRGGFLSTILSWNVSEPTAESEHGAS